MCTGRSFHIAWTGFQRRQIAMSETVGFKCVFFPVRSRNRFFKAIEYGVLFLSTILALAKEKPSAVWVQLPQIPALWAVLIYRACFNREAKVIADCHNAQLRAPWSDVPLSMPALRRADLLLVHNSAMRERAAEIGWPMDKVLVLEDVPFLPENSAPKGLAKRVIEAPKPWVVFPGSFAADEPIAEVLEAARCAPEMTFIITGRPERAERNGHRLDSLPSNVRLPGFLPVDVFDDLLCEADVVLGLTREEGIQLSVCNEALGFGRPLVTSNTRTLSSLFGEGAILVNSLDPQSIADGCRASFSEQSHWASLSIELANRRLKNWASGQYWIVCNALGD